MLLRRIKQKQLSSYKHITALLKKDLLLEIRQQYSFYGIILYVASTIFVLYLAMEQPEQKVWNGLFWMIQLFISVNAVAKSFLQESRGRMIYFYTIAGAKDFILAKQNKIALILGEIDPYYTVAPGQVDAKPRLPITAGSPYRPTAPVHHVRGSPDRESPA